MLDETVAAPLVRMVLDNVVREYPNHVMHTFNGDADALPPRLLHPAFYGSYDWHSAVHSHWMLVRVLRLLPQASFATDIHTLLDRHLTADNVSSECRYFSAPNRPSFERPYGLAWLLQLSAELAEWNNPDAHRWRSILSPLEAMVTQRFEEWLRKLRYPIRGGEHSNSAFSLALAFDWAQTVRDTEVRALISLCGRRLYFADRDAPTRYEPSGHDFLSPVLAEADFMRRILPASEFAEWFSSFMPHVPEDRNEDWLVPVVSSDPSDPKLAHFDGLNLSRAWMLQGIAGALAASDRWYAVLLSAADAHAHAGLAAISAERYEGSHWLPSFAVYLLTERGRQPG